MASRDWRYTLDEPYRFYVREFDGVLEEPFYHEWFTIYTDGWFEVNCEYSWDGATGWPDGPRCPTPDPDLKLLFEDPTDFIRVLTRGTLLHDAIYQFMEVIAAVTGLKTSEVRLIADLLLAVIARQDGASDWRLVRMGVRLLGGVYHGVRRFFSLIFK